MEAASPLHREHLSQKLTGAMVLSFAGTLWAAYGAWGSRQHPGLVLLPLLAAAGLLGAILVLRPKIRRLPEAVATPAETLHKAWA